MKKFGMITIMVLTAIIICASCEKNDIEDISFKNYPRVDGSTSARVLNQMVACKLLGISYEWGNAFSEEWYLFSKDIPKKYENFLSEHIKTSQTHGAFMNLIDKNSDIIITHRTISPDEKAYADAARVTLIETPIASDAFVFVVHPNNPIKSLSINEIKKIYTKGITNWSEVGGSNSDMSVYTRPKNSGSEEVFRTLVMGGLEPYEFPNAIQKTMSGMFVSVLGDENGICYTFNKVQA